jgi:hypothetical protein
MDFTVHPTCCLSKDSGLSATNKDCAERNRCLSPVSNRMTPSEFVTWLRGFVAGSHHYNLTPAGWDELKAQLVTVTDKSTTSDDHKG